MVPTDLGITPEMIEEQVLSFMAIPVVPVLVAVVLAVSIVVIVARGLVNLIREWKEVITMFDGMAISLTVNALTTQVSSFLSVPVVIPLALIGPAVGVVVLGIRGLRKIASRR
jgi:hypothetical protein